MQRESSQRAGPVSGQGMALGKRNPGTNDLGTSIGKTPLKRLKTSRSEYPRSRDVAYSPQLPLASDFDAKTRAARPPGGPSFDVRGRHPGTQRMGTGTGPTRPKGPISIQLTRNGGLMQQIRLPPSSNRTTFGFWTNNPVYYQLVLRRHEDHYNRMLSKAMPVFRFLGVTDDPAGEDVDVLVNLATMNYILRVQHNPRAPDPTPKEILREWGYFGVMSEITRELDDSVSGFEESMEGVPCIRGPVYSFNLWGKKAIPKTPLWFVLKMVDNIPDTFMLDPDNTRYKPVFPEEHGSLPRRSLQFVPYADFDQSRPPDSFCEYRDNNNELQMGVRIYVGKAQYPPDRPNTQASRESVYNVHRMVTASGQIWIMADGRPTL